MTDPTNTPPTPYQPGMLKTCPFCGHEVHGPRQYCYELAEPYWVIECGYCGANINDDDRETVIEQWNRRVKE